MSASPRRSSQTEPPSLEELRSAHLLFAEKEPRDLFYRAATELVRQAWEGRSKLSLPEAVAVLLQSWNASYYRYRGGFSVADFERLGVLLKKIRRRMEAYRARGITSFGPEEDLEVASLFNDTELALGPVGAAKALHLLAPDFFPIWDRSVARVYRCGLGKAGTNAARYVRFMRITQAQVRSIRKAGFRGRHPLKALDEFNYCRFTKKWPVGRRARPNAR